MWGLAFCDRDTGTKERFLRESAFQRLIRGMDVFPQDSWTHVHFTRWYQMQRRGAMAIRLRYGACCAGTALGTLNNNILVMNWLASSSQSSHTGEATGLQHARILLRTSDVPCHAQEFSVYGTKDLRFEHIFLHMAWNIPANFSTFFFTVLPEPYH